MGGRLVSIAALALPLFAQAAGQAARDPYLDLVKGYASGERDAALVGLARLSEGEQMRGFEKIQSLAVAAERCPTCPSAAGFLALPLKAAVMLHVDRDFELNPRGEEVEQPRACPGWQADQAGRYASLLARWPATREYARRFFTAMALRCQVAACLEHALTWGERGLKHFPRDAVLLYGQGAVHEETAVLMTGFTQALRPTTATRSDFNYALLARERNLKDARRFLGEAIAADGAFALARVRLGRVLWRLSDLDGARAALEAVPARTVDAATLYLARLFLGRVHEDAGRLDEAQIEYAQALQLDPKAQAAALSLSHVLRLQGDSAGSRRVLEQALAQFGERRVRDVFWDYLTSHVLPHPDKLFDELRRESLE